MSGTIIRSVRARQVYTNRGMPGVEAVVTTENGATGVAMCTSGVSVGSHEVAFTFDGGEKFRGKGVLGAVRNGDIIEMDVEKGILNVELTPEQIAERLKETTFQPKETFHRGFVRHYIDNVLQADEGCDFPYLR